MLKKIVKYFNLGLVCLLLGGWSAPQAFALSAKKDYQALTLYSNNAIVVDQSTGKVLYEKNSDVQKPIASISKLMTAIVTLDAKLPMNEMIPITEADVDTLRNSRSRLKVGPRHSRRELLQLALMSSENRAASALSRSYPGGRPAFIVAMNKKAKELGMRNTRFSEGTGLDSGNVSTARDLVKLVRAGFKYSLIREITTTPKYELKQGTVLHYNNTNPLFKDRNWQIGLSKTGYIKPSGHCLVMQTEVVQKPLIIVLLDAAQRGGVSADSNRIKRWFTKLLDSTKLAARDTDVGDETSKIDDIIAEEQIIEGGAAYSIAEDDLTGNSGISITPARVRTQFETARPLAISP